MIQIDGSQGEGGGQIVRSALALSLVTGTPFTISNIRARRKKTGLMRQHLTAVQAAATIGGADVSGAAVNSSCFSFRPQAVQPGEYVFDIGSAGSTSLVLQTVLPSLLIGEMPSRIVLRGGTHNTLAPPFDFLDRVYLPLVNRLGPHVAATLTRHGFYPAGGGECSFSITPAKRLSGLELLERGELRKASARAMVANLPIKIAHRELKVIADHSGWNRDSLRAIEVNGAGPGNVVLVQLEFDHATELFSGFGERGVPAETVANNTWREVREYLDANVPVGPHLADQIILPLGLAAHFGSPSTFRTTALTEHSRTHFEILRRFLDIRISAEELPRGETRVSITS